MLSIDVRAAVGTLELFAKLPAHSGTTVILGPNGAGKSTLLKSILGVLRPSDGAITLGDRTLFSSDSRIHVPIQSRRLGYVPQSYALFPHMTVRANVEFGIASIPTAKRRARSTELLEDLGIAHLADRKTENLSGGESQRVALARALAIGPQALLLDEPMAALDAGARRKVRRFLATRLRAVGIPTIVVSHDLDDVEALGGRVAVLEAGRIVQLGTLEEIRSAPATDFVREFFDDQPVKPPGSVSEVRGWT